jgi:hypothetical protein
MTATVLWMTIKTLALTKAGIMTWQESMLKWQHIMQQRQLQHILLLPHLMSQHHLIFVIQLQCRLLLPGQFLLPDKFYLTSFQLHLHQHLHLLINQCQLLANQLQHLLPLNEFLLASIQFLLHQHLCVLNHPPPVNSQGPSWMRSLNPSRPNVKARPRRGAPKSLNRSVARLPHLQEPSHREVQGSSCPLPICISFSHCHLLLCCYS